MFQHTSFIFFSAFNACLPTTTLGKDLHLAWLGICQHIVYSLAPTPFNLYRGVEPLPTSTECHSVYLFRHRTIRTVGLEPTTSDMYTFTSDALPFKLHSEIVGEKRLELSRTYVPRILSPMRLPIPPLPQIAEHLGMLRSTTVLFTRFVGDYQRYDYLSPHRLAITKDPTIHYVSLPNAVPRPPWLSMLLPFSIFNHHKVAALRAFTDEWPCALPRALYMFYSLSITLPQSGQYR